MLEHMLRYRLLSYVRLPCYCCGFITCSVMCLATFHHVVATCSSLFYHDMFCCNVCHVQLCVSHAFMIWWQAALCCHVFVMIWTHVLLSQVLLSHVAGTWFGHVVYVFVRSRWLVQLSHILEAKLAMCLVTCLVRCSSSGDVLRRVFCHIGSGLSHVGDVLEHIFCHLFDQIPGDMFTHCVQLCVLDTFGRVFW